MPGTSFENNLITSPVWAADFLSREHLMIGPLELDPTAFLAADGTLVTLSANAAQSATSIAFAATTNAIPSGTLLSFGTGKYAKTTAAAAAGATSVAVEALPVALTSGDVATYAGTGKKSVESGTYVGRTFTERESGAAFGPVASGDEERFLIAFQVPDLSKSVGFTGVRPGTVVKENFLPGYATMSTTIKGYLRADYQTQKGVA